MPKSQQDQQLRRRSLARWRVEHRKFLQSDAWKEIRETALVHYGRACVRCRSTVGLHVHHKSYKRHGGRERMEDLEVVCRVCHKEFHTKLRQVNNHRVATGKSRLLVSSVLQPVSNADKRKAKQAKRMPRATLKGLPAESREETFLRLGMWIGRGSPPAELVAARQAQCA